MSKSEKQDQGPWNVGLINQSYLALIGKKKSCGVPIVWRAASVGGNGENRNDDSRNPDGDAFAAKFSWSAEGRDWPVIRALSDRA
ncbi:MAG TPA: hypothetical protein VK465_12705 [Fibrobacteria bacterium]|nr:hypothetical protein [Fibrobacteria bacterium]